MNVGLNKIAETVGQVEEMQKSLAVKSAELQSKNDMANAKLKQMVSHFDLSILPFFYLSVLSWWCLAVLNYICNMLNHASFNISPKCY